MKTLLSLLVLSPGGLFERNESFPVVKGREGKRLWQVIRREIGSGGNFSCLS